MAFQARGRDPLLDSNMQAAIEKRSKELIGLVLIGLGVMAAAMIASYTPGDPSWMSATDAPVQNWMGHFGASIAAPMFMIIGWGSWGIAALLMAWGVRFALHLGIERVVGRVVFAPIVLALGAVYASTLLPSENWTHSFGMGGLFGDMVSGVILNILPVGTVFGLKLVSFFFGLGIAALAAFAFGFTHAELAKIVRFLLISVVMTYAMLMNLLGRGASGAVQAAQSMQARQQDRKSRAQERVQEASANGWAAAVAHDTTEYAPQQTPHHDHMDELLEEEPAPRQGLFARVPGLIKRPEAMPEPELVENDIAAYDADDYDDDAPGEDRIKAKIADVIKSRVRQSPLVRSQTATPLTQGRGRGPVPLILNTEIAPQGVQLPPEPPLTGGGAGIMSQQPTITAAHSIADAAFFEAPMQEHQEEDVWADYDAAQQSHNAQSYDQHAYDDQGYQPQDYTAEESIAQNMATPTISAPAAQPMPATVPVSMPIPVQPQRKVVQHAARKSLQPSTRAKAEAQPSLAFEESSVEYELPPLNLLANPLDIQRHHLSDDALEENARMLEAVLDDYGVKGEIVAVRPGPVVTMYELEPAPGLKASRVIGLADDIARSMSALSARVSTVPGRSVIGIELPNENREKVVLREILSARDFGDGNQKLPLALGKDIGGDPIVANLAKMPHLLIAGTTGSGKSVAINTMILSLLYKLTPDECRLIMIDPKMLELSVYDGIPHLLSPVVTDPKKAVVALKWTVGEMEERYRKMSKMGVRNIDGYNGRVEDALSKGETFSRTVQTGFDDDTGEPVFETEEIMPEKMPYIVVVVDEMADLMMVAGKEIEACIQRLAQMARASGIHLIMATQRPSVDVITGTIKANFPTRISFQVTSKIDSRTILGEMGAEQLLGMGDMLYMAGGSKIIRCHGPFVSDEEVEEIVNHLKSYGPPSYMSGVVDGPEDGAAADNIDAVLGLGGNTTGEDALYDQAVAIVIKDRKCSTSYIQRKLAIGYNKAARLVEQMEDEHLVSSANHVGKREILVPEQQ
jgi:S-DNA-T family DNA segregation ATPase FtsK/SpoIIIE